jgi:hypothetical protein
MASSGSRKLVLRLWLQLFPFSVAAAQLDSLPPDTPVRIRMPNGRALYGCAGSTSDSSILTFRLRKGGVSDRFGAKDCLRERTRVRFPDFGSVEMAQMKRGFGDATAKGLVIGAAAASALYWSSEGSKKRCRQCLINTTADWAAVGGVVGAFTGALIDHAFPEIDWVPLGGTEHRRSSNAWSWFLGKAKVEGTAGAGFAGIRVAEVLVRDSTSDGYIPVKNYRYDWRPAISTGVVTYIHTQRASNLGIGLGLQIVSTPTTEGKAVPFPGITLHIGTPETEFFAGLVLSSSDSIHVELDSVTRRTKRQPLSVNPQSLIFPNTRKSRHLYVGIQIKGTRKGIGDLGVSEKAHIEIDTPDSILTNQSIRLRAHMEDSLGNLVGTGPPKFDVAYTNTDATLTDGNLLNAKDSAGIVVIRVRLGGQERHFSVRIKAAEKPTPVPASPELVELFIWNSTAGSFSPYEARVEAGQAFEPGGGYMLTLS